MHLVIFEGPQWVAFAPLALSRPVFALATGTGSLLERQIRQLKPTRLTLWVRPEMEALCRERIIPTLDIPAKVNESLDDEPALLLNARSVSIPAFRSSTDECRVIDEMEGLRLVYCRRAGLGPRDVLENSQRWIDLLKLPQAPIEIETVKSIWDLIYRNDKSLYEDFLEVRKRPSGKVDGAFHALNPQDIWLSPQAAIGPGCVLDAGKGPVMIDAGAIIGANSVILGPCWIGNSARVRPLTQVREGVSIGPACTIGGEVSLSVFLGSSNKGHEGFLGHSYVGQWVNLGSGTTTSNLKNTYGSVRARVGRNEVDTGRQFLGAAIGDHSKTAILTRLGAGTYIGFNSMIAVSRFVPRLTPSFSFLTDEGESEYPVAKAIEVANRVMARRNGKLESIDEQLMHHIAATAPQIEQP